MLIFNATIKIWYLEKSNLQRSRVNFQLYSLKLKNESIRNRRQIYLHFKRQMAFVYIWRNTEQAKHLFAIFSFKEWLYNNISVHSFIYLILCYILIKAGFY